MQTYIAYYRVSTERQGSSGLGLAAQQEAVTRYLNNNPGNVLASFTEVESGKWNDRPELGKALAMCKLKGCALIVGKLDRMSRNARFLLSIVEGTTDRGVVFCDLPQLPSGPVGKFMLTQMAAVAELEAGLISERTKAALASAKARGQTLGGYRGGPVPDATQGAAALVRIADDFAAMVRPVIDEARAEGLSLAKVAERLTAQQIQTPRGGAWTATAVKRVIERFAQN